MTVTARGVGLAILLLLAAVLLPACAAKPPSDGLSNSDYVRHFETVAFYREFDPDKVQRRLTRWESPLHVALVGDVKSLYVGYTRRHLADLQALSRLPVSLSNLAHANVVVIFSPDPYKRVLGTYAGVYRRFFESDREMRAVTHEMQADHSTCFGWVLTKPGTDEIDQAVAVIPTDQGRYVVRSCIVEELTQAMGLFNDSDKVVPSIFNDLSPDMLLTPHDKILLKVLYDPRLTPGMTWSQAEPIVRKAVAELRG